METTTGAGRLYSQRGVEGWWEVWHQSRSGCLSLTFQLVEEREERPVQTWKKNIKSDDGSTTNMQPHLKAYCWVLRIWNILIHVTEGESLMYNVYIMSGYVIVSHQASYGWDPLGWEETKSGTNHHVSLELGRSEHFEVAVRSDEVRKNRYH